jgi:spore maturation protein CgeB
MMKTIREWRESIGELPRNEKLHIEEGRGGALTLKAEKLYLHSRYRPEEEARRYLDSADLDPSKPMLVIGLGLGYHVRELRARGFETAVVEADPAVIRLAIENTDLEDGLLIAAGDPEALAADPAFQRFAARMPRVLAHPPCAKLHPGYADAVEAVLSKAALAGRHLRIAVVGPLYGGSLPITEYLADAFRKLGHNARIIDNSAGWNLYQTVTESVRDETASAQLTAMLSNFYSEWSYARVAEFEPQICVVIAQAPVSAQFPARLAKHGIVTAFWYVENWRHLPYWQDIAPAYDWFFHIQPGEFEEKLNEIGCRHHAFVQTGCDPDVHRPVDLTPEEEDLYGCDISFAGAGYYNRRQLFKGLTDYDFKLWGVNWTDRDLIRLLPEGEKRFDSEVFMKIAAGTKINLNLHSSTSHEGVNPECDAINPRVFEIAAAGGFQVCDPCIGLDRHFDFETELPVYRNLKELRECIDYYLAHPEERRAIADRARKRAIEEHTYENRARQMLDRILETHGVKIIERGIRVEHTAAEMLERIEAGSELAQWLATLPPETPFTHDALKPLLNCGSEAAGRPPRIFAYMCEVFQFAEALMKEAR